MVGFPQSVKIFSTFPLLYGIKFWPIVCIHVPSPEVKDQRQLHRSRSVNLARAIADDLSMCNLQQATSAVLPILARK